MASLQDVYTAIDDARAAASTAVSGEGAATPAQLDDVVSRIRDLTGLLTGAAPVPATPAAPAPAVTSPAGAPDTTTPGIVPPVAPAGPVAPVAPAGPAPAVPAAPTAAPAASFPTAQG